jgi:4'-phosphopantetheinyl transferase
MNDVQILKCIDDYIPQANAQLVIVTAPDDSTNIVVELLARYMSVAKSAIQISRDEYGRKFAEVNGVDLTKVPDFSVSHAAGFRAVAIDPEGRIGVDMELVKPEVDLGIAQIAFTAAEQRWLFSLPAIDQARAFYHVWTAKEAFLKAIGRGIGFGMKQIDIESSGDGRFRLASVQSSRAVAAGWQLMHQIFEIDRQKFLVATVRA